MEAFEQTDAFRQALAGWFRENRRDLPWRRQRSLYRTIVSEFMLQQTQVKTVLPHFERWMERFPDFPALANAAIEDVLKQWEGLGYYRRARNLHRLAQQVAALPEAPATPDAWSELPGVGAYTAAAIASIAQGFPAAVVDGNVVRILARLAADSRAFTPAAAVKAFAPAAEALLDRTDPGQHNEAMMELGATVCLKRAPLCPTCPLASVCTANRLGDPEAYPRIQRPATEAVQTTRLWILRDRRLLLHRIPDSASRLAGQYELPPAEQLGPEPIPGTVRAVRTRSITRYRITETILQPDPDPELDARATAAAELHWIGLDRLETITLSGPHRRWVRELLQEQTKSSPGT